MILSQVVAAAENNAIGKNNQLLWHLPNDLRFFKNLTWAMPVLMGRKTFEAMGGKPLPGRRNIILTHDPNYNAEGAVIVHNLEEAMAIAIGDEVEELYIIGGGEIYRQTLPQTVRMYITRVHASLEGDTFFPQIDEKEWELVSNIDHPADEKHAYPYSFQRWERRVS